MDAGVASACAAFIFLSETQAKSLSNINKVRAHNPGSYMVLDEVALKNLEVIESPSGKEGTLLNCLDRTVTSMGTRMLKSWLIRPLLDLHKIALRHEAVGELAENFTMRDVLRDALREIADFGAPDGADMLRRGRPKGFGGIAELPPGAPEGPGSDSRVRDVAVF